MPTNARFRLTTSVDHLRAEFRIGVNGRPPSTTSFALAPRVTSALVGESGCGKSVTALSVIGRVPASQGANCPS
jgi:peptide/nickel transport system ATP-binding protein